MYEFENLYMAQLSANRAAHVPQGKGRGSVEVAVAEPEIEDGRIALECKIDVTLSTNDPDEDIATLVIAYGLHARAEEPITTLDGVDIRALYTAAMAVCWPIFATRVIEVTAQMGIPAFRMGLETPTFD